MPAPARHQLSPRKALNRIKLSRVPPQGWNNTNFHTANGQALWRDLVLAQRLSVATGMRTLAPKLGKWFDTFVDQVILRVSQKLEHSGIIFKDLNHYHRDLLPTDANFDLWRRLASRERGRLVLLRIKALGEIHLDAGVHETLWGSAIEEVMKESNLSFIAMNTSAVQSVFDSSHASTINLLGFAEDRGARARATRRVHNVASKVTGINDTTRERMRRIISKGIDDDLTVAEMAKTLREKFKDLSRSRISTIARTEMGQSADEGRKMGIKDSGVVTHCDVIGCTAREQRSPQYAGDSTCNATDVPVSDIDYLVFHINHTGSIVPSRFVEAGEEESTVVQVTMGGEPLPAPRVEPPQEFPSAIPPQEFPSWTPTVGRPISKTEITDIGAKAPKLAIASDADRVGFALAEKQGFTGSPNIVSADELQGLIDSGDTPAWRGVASPKYASAFRSGEYYTGKGTFGTGIYLASGDEGLELAESFALKGEVLTIAIDRNANLIGFKELYALMEKDSTGLGDLVDALLLDSTQKLRGVDIFVLDTVSDIGRYATYLGYDGIVGLNGEIVVLNRTVLHVLGDV